MRLALREASPEMHYQIESGIVVISPNPQQPVAVINKQKLVQGETISGARVIRILDYQVELEYQGRRFAIGL